MNIFYTIYIYFLLSRKQIIGNRNSEKFLKDSIMNNLQNQDYKKWITELKQKSVFNSDKCIYCLE